MSTAHTLPSVPSLTADERGIALKPVDSAWTVVFVDPIAVRVLPLLVRAPWITPVRLTIMAQLIGLGAAGLLSVGQLSLGAVAFELRFIIDCLDGKLARLRGETSRLGAVLDTNGDRVVVTASFAALAWWVDQPWIAFTVATTYLLAFALQEVRDNVYSEGQIKKRIEQVSSDGLGAALRRRRIYPTITTIEIEHAVLVVVPLLTVLGPNLIEGALVVASLSFGLQAARFALAALRAAALIDRTRA